TGINGDAFGAPLPLVGTGVPICVFNRLGSPGLTGFTADIATCAVGGTMALAVQAFRTSLAQVCPRCSGSSPRDVGVCDSGLRQGRGCITAGVVHVAGTEGNPDYALSADCPPGGEPVGTVHLAVPLTTATAALPGPRPCGAARDDGCGGTCTAACSGTACASTTNGQCVDAKGGLSQVCCSDDPQRPCFPTGTGASITRVGSATAPAPPFGDPTYPKVGGRTVAGHFCAPATGSD